MTTPLNMLNLTSFVLIILVLSVLDTCGNKTNQGKFICIITELKY